MIDLTLKHRWVQWSCVLIAILLASAAIGGLAIAQGAVRVGTIVVASGAMCATLWLAGGTFALAQIRWLFWLVLHSGIAFVALLMSLALFHTNVAGLAMAVLGVAAALRAIVVMRAYLAHARHLAMAVCILGGVDTTLFCVLAWAKGFTATAIVISGIASLAVVFLSGLWLMRLMLSGPRPIFGVARTLIDEAIRMKVALIFIVMLILVVPILPVLLDPASRLQYQMQMFLSWSLILTTLLLGLMTIFLASATICSEIDRHQIFLTMTKPVSRLEYLVGKWIGIGLLDGLLLTVLCGGIYTFTQLIQATGTPRDGDDWAALKWQVLTARQSALPNPHSESVEQMVDRRVQELQRQDPTGYGNDKLPARDVHQIKQMLQGRWHGATNRSQNPIVEQIKKTLLARWHTISPGNPQTFYFRNLQPIKQRAVKARQRREQVQVARLAHLAARATGTVEVKQFGQWAHDLAGAMAILHDPMIVGQAEYADDLNAALVQRQQVQAAAQLHLGELLNRGPDEVLQLRFKPRASENALQDRVRVALRINEQPFGERYQFALGLDHITALDNGQIQSHLRDAFVQRVTALSINALVTVEEPGIRWSISDEGGRYDILKEDNRLSVYGAPIHRLSNDNVHVLDLPAEVINIAGVLALEISNRTIVAVSKAQSAARGVTISLTPGEGLEIFHVTGGFEGNLFRSTLIIWIALCFLAMLGLMAGTFLGFPVACLLSLLVFVAGILSGYLSKALQYYVPLYSEPGYSTWDQIGLVFAAFWHSLFSGEILAATKVIIGLIGKGFVAVIPPFHTYNPIPLLIDGRMVSYGHLLGAAIWIGVVSTGFCWLIAWLVFRRRELARVMV